MFATKKLFSIGRKSTLILRFAMSNMSPKNTKLIAVVQLTSTSEKYENLAIVKKYVQEAASSKAKMVFLPEGCDYIERSTRNSLESAGSIKGEMVHCFCALAKQFQIWISFGGLHIKEENSMKLNNTHLIVNDKGMIVGKYEKLHLFDYKPEVKQRELIESAYVNPGNVIPPPVNTPCGRVAMGICYDLRFPEMSIIQRKAGAQILTFPSAFTVKTGEAHWETLIRARAIETQCYVVAAAQVGEHNEKRSSYGHSIVVDPWGKVLTQINSGAGISFAKIDLSYLYQVRDRMRVMTDRQEHVYSLQTLTRHENSLNVELQRPPSEYCYYKFGENFVPANCIVYKTFSSFVCVNKKPVSHYHLLAISDRPVPYLKDLTLSEVCDIAQSVMLSFTLLRSVKDPADIDIAIQDGAFAGQTVKHVHVHIVPSEPRHPNMKQGHEKEDKPWRQESEMAVEVRVLRSISDSVIKKNFDQFMSELPSPIELSENKQKVSFLIKGHRDLFEPIFCTPRFVVVPALNPILDGHTLLCATTSESSNFKEFNAGVISEMFQCCQLVEKFLMDQYNTTSVTIYCPISYSSHDNNLMVQFVPRQEGDLMENDQIYDLMKQYAGKFNTYKFSFGE